MKKTLLLAFTAVAALLAASCQKEDLGRVLTATIEQYEHNAKAYINNDYYACWENNDRVQINNVQCTVSVSQGNEHNYTATIEGQIPTDQDLLAFYPASQVSNLTSTGGTVSLPHLQTYETTTVNGVTYQKINNPMAAYCPQGSDKLKFRNLCALLKVTIQGNTSQDVRAIQVRGIENQMLCGKAPLTFDNNHQPALGLIKDGDNSVTLQIPAEATPASNTFYIVVPANTNFTQLTIAVLLKDGDTYITYCKTSLMNQSLPRNHIGAFTYSPSVSDNDQSLQPDWMIRYTGSTSNFRESFGDAQVTGNNNGILLCDRPLTSIGDSAFYECSSLTSISLPAGVTSIGEGAFAECRSLTSITLPAGVTSIGPSAFNCCRSLTSITLPAGVTSIGPSAFYNCSILASITLPAGVTSIGEMAFEGCRSLTSIDLPDNLTSIGKLAFNWCSSLTSISLPAGVTSIGMFAFAGCGSLAQVYCYAITPPELGTRVFDDIPSTAVLHVPTGKADTYSGSPWGTVFSGEGRIKGDL